MLLQLQVERDQYLGRHIHDIGELAYEIDRLRLAAELHDVGKAAIPDAILEKSGKLDDAEWEFMRRHTVIGESIRRAAPALADVADLVRRVPRRRDAVAPRRPRRVAEGPVGD